MAYIVNNDWKAFQILRKVTCNIEQEHFLKHRNVFVSVVSDLSPLSQELLTYIRNMTSKR